MTFAPVKVDEGRTQLSKAADGLIDEFGRISHHVPDEIVRAEISAAAHNRAQRIRALTMTPMTMCIKVFCEDFPCSRDKAYRLMRRRHDPLPYHVIDNHRTIYLSELFLWLLRQPVGSIRMERSARRIVGQKDRLKSVRAELEPLKAPPLPPRPKRQVNRKRKSS